MKSILSISVMLFFLLGCTKPLIDYRSKYVGEYHVISYNSSWVMGQIQQYDTIQYTIKVRRSNTLYYVDFISNSGETSYLMETDGTLHYDSPDWHYHVNGGFTDKNHFELTGGYYGLGGGNSFEAHGSKK